MTNDHPPAARKWPTHFRLSTACLAGTATLGAVASAIGVRVSLPLWLILAAAGAVFASGVVGSARPAARRYLDLAVLILSLAAMIGMIIVAARRTVS